MQLIQQPKSQVVERILKTKAGVLVRASLLVVEFQGQIRVKLLSAVPLELQEALGGTSQNDAVTYADFQAPITLSLPEGIVRIALEPALTFGEKPVPSPYTNLEFLFTSQPTRAPSFVI